MGRCISRAEANPKLNKIKHKANMARFIIINSLIGKTASHFNISMSTLRINEKLTLKNFVMEVTHGSELMTLNHLRGFGFQ
jgi:hypothetical protein